jgi:hypothetical protein
MRKLLVVAVAGVLGTLVTPGVISWLSDRPIRGPIQYWLFHDDTSYASKYSERALGELRAGMLRAEVEQLLGPPLRILYTDNGRIMKMIDPATPGYLSTYPDLPPEAHQQPTGIVYFYSWPGKESDHWFVRSVGFSTNGQVEHITRAFEAD